MTATIAEPVADTEVLTALDFATPPVEVKTSVVDNKVVYTMPYDVMVKSYWQIKSPLQCGCGACSPHSGPMDPTAKALWVEGLRDPSRKQGRGALRQGDLWCALGVLIDVAIKAGVKVQQGINPTGTFTYDGMAGALPTSVAMWAGLRGDPKVGDQSVSFLNDAGMPFAQIANRIERFL